MKKYTLKNDLSVFGVPVTTFPNGIGEVFDSLIRLIPDGLNRSYFGISKMDGEEITYIAAAEQKENGESEKFRCNNYLIEGGEYFVIEVKDWRSKTDSIKNVFGEMMQDPYTDKSKPCVEWYRTDIEMWCMMKVINK